MRPTKLKSLEILRSKGLPVGTVIDIGVHKQTPELIKIFPDKLHLLFEPVEEFYPFIQKNYKHIPYELFPIALSDKEAEGWLRVFDVTGQGEITHASITFEKQDEMCRPIRILPLDKIIKERQDQLPYLIKIDVDGIELEILHGAINTLKLTSCVVIEAPISINPHMFYDRINFLSAHDFALWDIVDFCYYKNELSQVDLIFIKNEIKKQLFSPWQQGPFDPSQWEVLG